MKDHQIRAVIADVKELAEHAESLRSELDALQSAAREMLDAFDGADSDAAHDGDDATAADALSTMRPSAERLRRQLP